MGRFELLIANGPSFVAARPILLLRRLRYLR
jgi:hypothetical protein